MAVIYKIVCEIKWMHEYYLTSDKGNTVFDLAAQTDRINFLFQQFVKDEPTINSDLDFTMPLSQKALFDDLKLKIIPSYSGFKLAVKCKKKILNDGTTVYEPFISFPDNLIVPVAIQEISSIAGFSNNKLVKPLNPALFFSTDNIPVAKTFPFLSNPVAAFDGTAVYEQGEIATHGANDVRVFLNNGAIDPWLKLKGTGVCSRARRAWTFRSMLD